MNFVYAWTLVFYLGTSGSVPMASREACVTAAKRAYEEQRLHAMCIHVDGTVISRKTDWQ